MTRVFKDKKATTIPRLLTFSRFIAEILLIVSGFLNGNDLMGLTYKLDEYFNALGMYPVNTISMFLGLILSAIQFVLGTAFVFNLKFRAVSVIALYFTGLITFIVLLHIIFNPLQRPSYFIFPFNMAPWLILLKNLLVLSLVVFLFIHRSRFQSSFSNIKVWSVMGFSIMIIVGYSLYGYRHLPVLDFSPYKVGSNLKEMTDTGNQAQEPGKSGVSMSGSSQAGKTKKILDPIRNFKIETSAGREITKSVINQMGFTYLLISPNLNEAETSHLDAINRLAEFCNRLGYCSFIGLTASSREAVRQYIHDIEVAFSFFRSEEHVLKAMVRSNPGVILLNKGMILGKWHYNDLPRPGEEIPTFQRENEPIMKFDTTIHDFGKISYKGDAGCIFTFKNTGEKPLILTSVRTSCGCTSESWTEKPIGIGDTGTVAIKYDTTLKGSFSKSILVYSNAGNSPVRLRIRGEVLMSE